MNINLPSITKWTIYFSFIVGVIANLFYFNFLLMSICVVGMVSSWYLLLEIE